MIKIVKLRRYGIHLNALARNHKRAYEYNVEAAQSFADIYLSIKFIHPRTAIYQVDGGRSFAELYISIMNVKKITVKNNTPALLGT